MENSIPLIIPILMGIFLLRILLMPMALFLKLAAYSGSGFLCLWLLNLVSGFTGIYLPINGITILVAGFLGIPGIGLLAFLEIFA